MRAARQSILASIAMGLMSVVVAGSTLAAEIPGAYAVHNLVSDGSVPADNTDPNLIDGWGVAFNPNGFVWVNSAVVGKAVLYDGNGVPQSLVVSIPATANGGQGIPTGIVFSSTGQFAVSNGAVSGAPFFIFASLTGSISGWAPNVDFTNALVGVDNSGAGASYTGLALAANGTANHLYAVDVRGGQDRRLRQHICADDARRQLPRPAAARGFHSVRDPQSAGQPVRLVRQA
jgi:hypothetical protein